MDAISFISIDLYFGRDVSSHLVMSFRRLAKEVKSRLCVYWLTHEIGKKRLKIFYAILFYLFLFRDHVFYLVGQHFRILKYL